MYQRAIAVLFMVFALDQLTKYIARAIPVPALTLNEKTFFFLDGSVPSFVFLAVLLVLLGIWFIHELRAPVSAPLTIASAFIFGGALSNFLDRIRIGAIVDWIPIPGLTVFNLADGFIIVGCVLVFVSFFSRKRV